MPETTAMSPFPLLHPNFRTQTISESLHTDPSPMIWLAPLFPHPARFWQDPLFYGVPQPSCFSPCLVLVSFLPVKVV
jgi:hypothetical protein